MKCPKCGNEIPEGQLYCEKCGAEIRIVSEYDAGLEQQISENMDSIREEVRRQIKEEELQKRAEQEQKQKNKLKKIRILAAAALVVAVTVVIFACRPTQAQYVGRAYTAAEKGNYRRAAELIDKAIALEGTGDTLELVMTKTRYLESAGDLEAAEKTIRTVTDDTDASDDDRIRAYQLLIDIYASQDRYEDIAAMIADSPEAVREAYHAYLSSCPVFSENSGTYEGSLTLTLSDDNGGSIFYTLDGSRPDLKSNLYREPIELTHGSYTVTAITVNKYGVVSAPVSQHYQISGETPDEPEISPASGTYTGSMLIKASASGSGKIYYTTDGSDPNENSRVYSSPIEMPVGTTTYRFITIDENGNASSIVERTYTLSPSAEISINDGPAYIIRALIGTGEIVDTDGTTSADATAKYTYSYLESRTITGYGSFYIYSEFLVDSSGNSASTGRRFAVNVSNATVNLYGDIGNGDQLFPLS